MVFKPLAFHVFIILAKTNFKYMEVRYIFIFAMWSYLFCIQIAYIMFIIML